MSKVSISAERAKYSFREGSKYRKLLDIHQDAFYGGAPYPDSFYDDICHKGAYHDVSEDTHWGEFLNATINYINKQSKPWDIATEKLFVFMMAFMSHQVADITWHSMYIEQGFLHTMGYMNFHGSYPKAHPVGDFGGDVWNAYSMLTKDDSLFPEKPWYVPVDDLYHIYQDFYGKTRIDKNTIEICSSLQLLAGVAELLLGAEAFLTIANDSNFLIDNEMEYFEGGLTDMASLTTRKWNDAITMIENGTRACSVPHSTVFINCTKGVDSPEGRLPKLEKRYYQKPKLFGLTLDDLIITPFLRGVKVQLTENLKLKLIEKQKKRMYFQSKYSKEAEPAYRSQPNFTIDFRSSRSYSQLGWSMISKDLDDDGNEDLVIGSPGHSTSNEPQRGRVYILYSGNAGLQVNGSSFVDLDNFTSLNASVLEGNPGEYSRFGYALAALDLNQDGNVDMAISASSSSYKGLLDYNGVVYVYFGSGGQRSWKVKPDLVITCQLQFCNLGSSMTSIDINNDGKDDLLIGSPFASVKNLTQNGMVTVLLSSKSLISGMVISAEKLTKNWILFGNQSYSWYGHRLSVKNNMLMVSQPYFRKCISCEKYLPTDIQSVGKLNVFSFKESLSTTPSLTFTGQRRSEMTGYSSDIGDPFGNGSSIFAIGVPGMDVKGKVYSSMENLIQGGGVFLISSYMQDVAHFTGDRMFSRFGSVVKFSDVNGDGIDDLLISAPIRNDNPNILINSRINGKVYIFYGGRNFPKNSATVTPDCGNVSPCPEKVANQTLGYGLDLKTDFGRTITVLRSKQQVQVIVSAPRNGDNIKLKVKKTGNVYVYNTK
ncbi:phosphatidylinositol-glycan-specific phospholipase D-like [Saccostrea echinata]|uniref:phosphatidylinositol-glycan-specific phospholipase D-like n=1 Tax=Saccostrea echinata TaxID=191078 RepID=UPI002A823ABA|nr:phosphatidylinositol-glycan-specific phospholipase D-like [Saccostrea echinata]